ncbi:MAG: DUF2141 domain-containing protein [Myxococcota bacterium]
MGVRIRIEGIRNSDGLVACALFDQAGPFPGDKERAAHGEALPAEAGVMEFVFFDVTPGRYAVSVLHDENSNGRLDTNLLGMPKEGYGISNGAFRRFGPPRFEEAALHVHPGDEVRIVVRYPRYA